MLFRQFLAFFFFLLALPQSQFTWLMAHLAIRLAVVALFEQWQRATKKQGKFAAPLGLQ
jgi:hypothetical protein